jgi:hypothetical protein
LPSPFKSAFGDYMSNSSSVQQFRQQQREALKKYRKGKTKAQIAAYQIQQKKSYEKFKRDLELVKAAERAKPKKLRRSIKSINHQSPSTIKKKATKIRESGSRIRKPAPRMKQGFLKSKRGEMYGYYYSRVTNYKSSILTNFENFLTNKFLLNCEEVYAKLSVEIRGNEILVSNSGQVLQKNKIYHLSIRYVDMCYLLSEGIMFILNQYLIKTGTLLPSDIKMVSIGVLLK